MLDNRSKQAIRSYRSGSMDKLDLDFFDWAEFDRKEAVRIELVRIATEAHEARERAAEFARQAEVRRKELARIEVEQRNKEVFDRFADFYDEKLPSGLTSVPRIKQTKFRDALQVGNYFKTRKGELGKIVKVSGGHYSDKIRGIVYQLNSNGEINALEYSYYYDGKYYGSGINNLDIQQIFVKDETENGN